MEAMHEGIVGFSNDMKNQWQALVAKIPTRTHYTENTPVVDLERAWLDIIALEGGNV